MGGYWSDGVNIKALASASTSLGSLLSTTYFSNFKNIHSVFFSSDLSILQWFHSGCKERCFWKEAMRTSFLESLAVKIEG